MSFRLALAQTGYPSDGDVIAQVETYAAQAASAGAALVAFPENLMHPHVLHGEELRRLAEPLDGPFMQAMGDIAARHGVWIVGTMNERTGEGNPFNTAFVVDDAGALRDSYRKCHLYDAHTVRESDRLTAGNELFAPLQTPFCTLGLGICYDLRFPELARVAAAEGCNLLLYPAAWHDGPHKRDHWKTLLRARAIENELFVAGIGHAGGNFVGESLVADPLGTVVVQGPDAQAESLLVADIDLAAVAAARTSMPILSHRRPELYR